MKKIILGAALCGLLAAGCSLDKSYLNGPNALTFPASKAEVEAGVFAAYKGLTLIDASSTPFPGIQDNASDIGASRLNAANYNYQQQSKLPTDNAWVEKVYNNIYKTAARANLVLDGIDKVRDLMSEQEYNMYKAELLLTRAYVYEWGCQLYGDIPYIDHVLGLGDSYTRTPRAEVIDKILNEDLKDEMLDFLPLRHNKATYGSTRLGRVGAYGLKARICLNWGFFEEAAKYADKALTLAKDAGYALEPYDTRFCGEDYTKGEPSATNLFGLSGHANSDEWIWALQYNAMISGNQHNAGYYAAPRIAGGCSYFSPTQMFIDAIQCTDGKSIAESPLFDYKEPWKNRDPRLDLFCVRPGSRVLGMQFETNPSVQKIMNYNDKEEGVLVANSEAYGTKSEYGANGSKGPCGYLWRKYLDIEEYRTNNGLHAELSAHASGRIVPDPRRGQHRMGGRRSGRRQSRHRDHPRPRPHARTDGIGPQRAAFGTALRAHGRVVQRRIPLVRHPTLGHCRRGDFGNALRSGIGRFDVERHSYDRRKLARDLQGRHLRRKEDQPAQIHRHGLRPDEGLPVADPRKRAHRPAADHAKPRLRGFRSGITDSNMLI